MNSILILVGDRRIRNDLWHCGLLSEFTLGILTVELSPMTKFEQYLTSVA